MGRHKTSYIKGKSKLQIRCGNCSSLYKPEFSGMKRTSKSRVEFWSNLESVVCPHCKEKRKTPKKETPAIRAKGQV